MNNQVDRTYYESIDWRSMRGCNNCAGYEPDDLGIGGINQCANGKDNANGHLCNCDAWTPDFKQALIDKVSQLESQLAKRDALIAKLVEVGDKLVTINGIYRDGDEFSETDEWIALVTEYQAMGLS